MKSFVALAFAGAALAIPTNDHAPPPAYEAPPPAYGAASTTTTPMVYQTTTPAPYEPSSTMPPHETTTPTAYVPTTTPTAYVPTTTPTAYVPTTTPMAYVPTTTPMEHVPMYNTTVAVHEPDVYVTAVYTSFVTYCPKATTVTYGAKTYTVSSATTLTVTDCPGGCQVTCPVTQLPPVVTTYVTKDKTVTSTVPAETVTAVVPQYTTVMPKPTTITISSKVYTATATSETLTITATATVTLPVSSYVSQYSAVVTPPPAVPYVPAPSGTAAPSNPPASATDMMPIQSGIAPARLANAGVAGAMAIFGGLFFL